MELRIRVGFDARLRAPNRACAGVRRDLPPSGAHLIQPGILKVVARPGIELRAQGFSVSRLRQGTNQYANNRQNRGNTKIRLFHVWQYLTEEGINEIILIRSPSHPSARTGC
jgi:hypothetical protein